MSQDDKSKQSLKRQSRNHAEIDRRNRVRLVAQEGSPILGWRSLPSDHVLGDRRLGDFEPKLKQFVVDTWGAPQRVLLTHPSDKDTQATIDLWPPCPIPGLPAPDALKPARCQLRIVSG